MKERGAVLSCIKTLCTDGSVGGAVLALFLCDPPVAINEHTMASKVLVRTLTNTLAQSERTVVSVPREGEFERTTHARDGVLGPIITTNVYDGGSIGRPLTDMKYDIIISASVRCNLDMLALAEECLEDA